MESQYDRQVTVSDAGAGWLIFAGTILGMAGIMRIFDGIWAFQYDGAVPDKLEGAVLGTSLSTYGWIWIAIGLILIICSFAVFSRSQLARWIGIVAGAGMAITAIWWMPYYPVWSLVYIISGVVVIYALAASGARDQI
jgi:hypothetical protein